jgi:hypothetical protein
MSIDIRDAVALVMEGAKSATAFAQLSDAEIMDYYMRCTYPTRAYWMALSSAIMKDRLNRIMNEVHRLIAEEEAEWDAMDRHEQWSDY